MTRRSRAAFGALLLGLLAIGCGIGDERSSPEDSTLDARVEELLSVILEVERSGGAQNDTLTVRANQLIDQLGGRDSTVEIIASRLLHHADRWIPLLDSLARATTTRPPPTTNQ